MTKKEAAIITAYTGTICCDIETFQKYIVTIADPVQLINPNYKTFEKHLYERSETDFLKMIHNLTDD